MEEYIWFKLLGLYLVRYRFAPMRKLSWCPWWTFLECLLCACHYILLMNLPMRKDVSEKPVQTIIPRNELLMEQSERPSPRAIIWENSSRLSPTGPHCRKETKESSIQREWGNREGKGHDPKWVQGWVFTRQGWCLVLRWTRNLSTCGQVSSFLGWASKSWLTR